MRRFTFGDSLNFPPLMFLVIVGAETETNFGWLLLRGLTQRQEMQNLVPEKDPIEALRSTFRRHASGVSVITLLDDNHQPIGFTATSMTSLGANPPLASFNVSQGSSTFPSLKVGKYAAIHTLGANTVALAQKMAADHTQRFVGDDWHEGPYRVPVFPAATSILIVKIRDIHNIENNAVVIVDVIEGLAGTEDEALLYYQRSYMKPGEKLV
jgi:flavin reductase (DIM6/NTAB) family NADH-FMN oxidoreductase RutF